MTLIAGLFIMLLAAWPRVTTCSPDGAHCTTHLATPTLETPHDAR